MHAVTFHSYFTKLYLIIVCPVLHRTQHNSETNKAGRSTQAADTIHEKLNVSLISPIATRWNSNYYAMDN